MDKKLLFFDIDGTLFVEGDYYIPPSTIEAIHLAQAHGHLCFINTGRPYSTIDQIIHDIGFDGYVCGCGTYVKYKDKVIHHALLDKKSMDEIIQLSFECNVDNVLEGINGTYFPENMDYSFFKEVFDYYRSSHFPAFTYNKNTAVIFDKMAVWIKPTSLKQKFLNYFYTKDHYDVIDRGENFYEIVPLSCSKATGIQIILDYLHYDISNTISIGDSTNDLSMLTYTKESIAMGNAHPSLFDKVTYVTTDINNDGIYNALKHFKII